ncbi:translocation protein sec72 [Nannizzia gypsea CBS 118893]|uniref:Translocation protein sec72 n=1 Tax=Arthroderma gypseum (strain ATCC MYA-4604 / CBS 118893) TaxID=535722 RepID=E4UT29_ARTGP|nr:translocation protein sec72 [Nannizzia gypsea CBS 118893]EFR00642.1 translocation protein sec72 [Nannizzia gypsea CBS 118893]
MASDAETFTQYPIHLDPTSKALSDPTSTSAELNAQLEAINQTHRALLNLEPPNIPPPPRPVNPKRSAQIGKLRDTANAAYRKSSFAEAAKMYTLAIDMALGRPMWEPVGLVREELSALYANRAQAYMQQQLWAEAWVDAQLSVECNEQGNGKAWWRGGKCLVEMGRWEEAQKWITKALDIESAGDFTKELNALLVDIHTGLGKKL